MTLGVEAGVSSAAWSGAAAGHVLHAGLEFLMAQAEPGVCCPMTMTAAAPAALRCQPDIAARWMPKIVASRYDPSSQPMHGKSGVTIGMAMTEKQGGSDVRANTTRAVRRDDGGYRITWHNSLWPGPIFAAVMPRGFTHKGLTPILGPPRAPPSGMNA